MDYLLGSIISDYLLYQVIESIIAILSMITVYFGIQIALTWKFLNKGTKSSIEVISEKTSFNRSTFFIFIAGFFMVIHELFEGLEKEAPDYVTYEFFELIALAGFVMFFYEWNKILKNLKNRKN